MTSIGTLCARNGVYLGLVALLASGAATACGSGQPEAPAATAGASDPDGDAIPATPSPLDALPKAVRSVLDPPFTGGPRRDDHPPGDSRGGHLQPHALLHRQGAGT